ncbi:MAG: zinc ribbon domain-containing protein [Candidatus Brockarchaeota archaeon]|nr:zinc ribbon domain-containing protein [Candidatus Brockarchaeota archaeon]MBO3808356.1 zinc ribbon domain-containing protein [Candidatus Brockarchaeota archaeon]
MNKANVLAAGVLLIAVGLYFQTIPQNPFEELVEEATYKYLTTAVFWTGIIVVVVSILIKPRRRIIAPAETVQSEAVEEGGQKEAAYHEAEAAYSWEEAETVEKEKAGLEQAYEEGSPAEEAYEPLEEEALEKEEEPEKVGEIIGFCPRCGAPVSEGMRYCRKCGLKLK